MTKARRGLLAGPLLAALCLAPAPAAAQARRPRPAPKPADPRPAAKPADPTAASSIAVVVVEIAGSEAYVQPGARGGVHRGAMVTINRSEYPVIQTTSSYAVIDIGDTPLHEQDRGQASMVAEQEEKARELRKPRPLAAWANAWPAVTAPASEQAPRFVPLGNAERDRRWDIRLTIGAGTLLPLDRGGSTSRVEVNARVHAEPFTAPLALDLDISVLRWFASDLAAREGGDARPLIWLREALVGYGGGSWYAGIGRMRYAASTLGTLDGSRVATKVGGGFSVGAFGGVVPHPLSGEPSLAAQRFGVETTFSRPELALRPEAALVAQGSTFGGGLDERRLSGVFGLYPGLSRFGGHFELSNFDPHNEWKASPIELTAAGLDASVRAGVFQLGARADVRQPDRSRWLSSFLPTSWFCRQVPSTTGAEPCDGRVSTRALGAVDVGVELGRFMLTVGGTKIGDLTQKGGAPDMTGGFASARVVRIAKVARIDASANYSQATYMKLYGGSAGPGVSLFADALDLSAFYRYTTLEYRASDAALLQHGVGTTVMLFPNAAVLFTLQGEAVIGDDANALLLFGTAMWRPRF